MPIGRRLTLPLLLVALSMTSFCSTAHAGFISIHVSKKDGTTAPVTDFTVQYTYKSTLGVLTTSPLISPPAWPYRIQLVMALEK